MTGLFVPAAAATSFVEGGAYMPVADLLANYPASAGRMGSYARVNDLWGSIRSVMVCESDGTSYYWRPQRTDYAVSNAAASGAVTLTPLVTAPFQIFTATLTNTMTVTPSATNAWPGCTFDLAMNGILGIFGVTVTGLLGGNLALPLGGSRRLMYTAAGWRGV